MLYTTSSNIDLRRLMIGIAAFVVLVGLGYLVASALSSGMQVTVENTGTAPLRALVLHVTGNSYALGDLSPVRSVKQQVNATGESHLEIEFTDAQGKKQRLNAGGYFESGYRGTIRIVIKDEVIVKNECQIQVGPY